MTTTPQPDNLTNGFDRGDLLADIDRQCGDAVERAIHRHLPKGVVRSVRQGIVEKIGDIVITYDKTKLVVKP